MSAVVGLTAGELEFCPPANVIRNAEGQSSEVVELRGQALCRLDGDNRWRIIACRRGEIWVTQERDLRDYVIADGQMLIITQRGTVLIEALDDALVEITPPLNRPPYRGGYPIFQ